MPTTLELLQAERDAQDAEEARPAFQDVQSLRTFIADTSPAPTENVSLEMCVLAIKILEKCLRMDLIDRSLEAQFNAVASIYNSLDPARRSKFVFQLTVWKNQDINLHDANYRVGFSYRFEKVHSLRSLYGHPVGSVQIRQRIRAVPLPPLGFEDDTRPPEPTFQDPTDTHIDLASEDDATSSADSSVTRGSPLAKFASKRKVHTAAPAVISAKKGKTALERQDEAGL